MFRPYTAVETHFPVIDLKINCLIPGRIHILEINGKRIALLEEVIPGTQNTVSICLYTPLIALGHTQYQDDRQYYGIAQGSMVEVYTPHRDKEPDGSWKIISHFDEYRMVLLALDRARTGRDIIGDTHHA